MKYFFCATALAVGLFISHSPAANAGTSEKVCFYPANAGVPSMRCYNKDWAEKNGYDMSKAFVPEKRTENPMDSKICFYPANAGVPSMRCYNKQWAEKNGFDLSKGFMPVRYVASMNDSSSTTTECTSRTTNGKPRRVCYQVEK